LGRNPGPVTLRLAIVERCDLGLIAQPETITSIGMRDEALQTRPVEAVDSVTQRLAAHSADLRRRASVHAVPNRS
jgi:hypothetical protein